MKTVSTNKAPAAIGPYSQAQIVGGMVYTSGQIGIDPATGIVPEGVEAQAHQVFKNLTELLQAAGSDMSKVVKTTVFIKDMNDFGLVNGIYADPRLGISKEDRFPRPASMPRYDCSENADGTDQSPDGISDDDEFFD